MLTIEEYVSQLRLRAENNQEKCSSTKVKTIMKYCGYSRRSQNFIDEFNKWVKKLKLKSEPRLDLSIPFDAWIKLEIIDNETLTKNNEKNETEIINKEIINDNEKEETEIVKVPVEQKLHIPKDFFGHLFDFGSKQEYERFQACLDANVPIGLFLIPDQEDFFSELVEKILLLEVIRKRQYQKNNGESIKTSKLDIANPIGGSNELKSDSREIQEFWTSSDIFHFNQATMYSVILGNTSHEIIESEKFDETFQQLSLYSNKYLGKQFYILFHCPAEEQIIKCDKQDLMERLMERVTLKLPFVFKLRCKYKNDKSVENREEILNHFKILLDVPNAKIDVENYSLVESFLELQKIQLQSESQLLLKILPEYYDRLSWGNESDEHIHLKYFAIKSLVEKGYNVKQIERPCEINFSSIVK